MLQLKCVTIEQDKSTQYLYGINDGLRFNLIFHDNVCIHNSIFYVNYIKNIRISFNDTLGNFYIINSIPACPLAW